MIGKVCRVRTAWHLGKYSFIPTCFFFHDCLYVVKHKSLEVLGVVLKCIQHIIHREEIQLSMMYLLVNDPIQTKSE